MIIGMHYRCSCVPVVVACFQGCADDMHGHCRGAPRHNAKAKDSEWVLQRQGLEQQKPADVNEVVLSTPEGHIMEGLTSNFFVLQGGSVVTADEGVLSGTVRELVLEVSATAQGCFSIPRSRLQTHVQQWPVWVLSSATSTAKVALLPFI